jgi:hypothetical protein
MSVIQGIQNLIVSTRVGATRSDTGQATFNTITPEAHADFLRARTELLNLYRDIERLAELTNINTRFKLDLPDARSASALGLDLTSTPSTLNSSQDINASPMSFSPFGPDWQDGSSALITLGGEYLGNNGTGQLNFLARRSGPNVSIRVTDSIGGPTRNISIDQSDPTIQYSLQNGLYFTLGPGSLINRDTTTVQVYDNVGAVVNPDLPLGGQRNENPNLQYGLPGIVDGSFSLNGESISVLTTDTLNEVVQRINESGAGVSAVFNPVTEQIEFEQNTLGSAHPIDLTGDTSNFLEATKLDSVNTILGVDPDSDKTLDAVGAFAAVQTGDIVINGESISIDANADSLTSVLAKINGSSAGVLATFDPASQLVTIEANDAATVLELDSNGTNLFAALKIPEGRVDPEAVTQGVSRRKSYEIADAATAVFDRINRLLKDSTFLDKGKNVGALRAPIEAAVRGAFAAIASGELFGIQFDGSTAARARGDYLEMDRRDFTSNLQRRGDLVRDFLAGENDEGGFVQNLLGASRQALNSVNQALGLSGTFVDTYV